MAAPLHARIREDVNRALKARDGQRVAALRLVVDALQQEEIAARKDLTDADILNILGREAKRRREAAAAFVAGGRPDRGKAEQAEADLIAAYLPRSLGDVELERVVRDVVAQQGAGAQLGKVIGAVMARVRSSADGTRVREVVSRILRS